MLENIIDKIVGGGTPRRDSPEFWGSAIPWATVKDFTTFSSKKTQEYISEEGVFSSATHIIPAGTLIIATRIALGKTSIYEIDIAINQDLKAIFFKININVKFMHYWCQWQEKNFQSLGNGSTVQGISLDLLKKIHIALPSNREQQSIAAALSDVDELLSSLDRLIAKKKDVRLAAMQELLTGKTRLPGFSGPWSKKLFGELFEFLPTNAYTRAQFAEEGTIRNIHYGDILTKYENYIDVNKSALPFINDSLSIRSYEKKSFLTDGDIIIANTAEDSSVGKAGVPDAKRLGFILYNDIVKFLLPANGWANFTPLFGLSDDDEMRVQAVLNRVSQFEVKKIAGYRKRLDKSLKRSQEIREKLQNSSIENYQEHTDAISKITREIYDLSLQLQSKQIEITTCERDIIAAEKDLGVAYKKLEIDIKRRSVSAISSKVLLLLEDLQAIIFDRLIRKVRKDTLTEFNRLIRKKKFIDDIQIDKDFRVHLLRKQIVEKKDLVRISRRSGIAGIQRSLRKYAFSQLSELIGNPDGRNFGKALEGCHLNEFELMMEIDKDTLSKGETQIFVMSLYWAMMQQCKCELPFIIDTPFARIDTDHRVNIVEQFFKRLPGQLFILSTNEEISSKHMLALHDQTSNMFLLDYGDDKCTQVIENQYFEV